MTKRRRGRIMSPELLKVAERARIDPNARFNSLARLIDKAALKRAFDRIRRDAAKGVDDIDKEMYEADLEQNLQDLYERLKSGKYRHRPIRRVNIPKGKGKTRPIGISTVEDKIVQGALSEVLGAIYEQDFLPCSHGFRPGRRTHDALRDLDQMAFREGIGWILEADISAFFDSIDRRKLLEMLATRVADRSFLRLIGKCLHVGVLDGEEYSIPTEGTAQGSVISPLLGNVYLHYVLDLWFERVVRPLMRGHARLIRYADDFVIGFQHKQDAERVLEVLHKRMAKFGLSLHPEKTRLVQFGRPMPGQKRARTGTIDFLGFTAFWHKSRKGAWILGMKTRKASFRKAVKAISQWCRRHRHLPLEEQHAALNRRLNGHDNHFAVNGNYRSLSRLRHEVRRVWFKWLKRRHQHGRPASLTWERFQKYLNRFPLSRARIKVRLWG